MISAQLDGCGYMQPRTNFRPGAYKIGFVPGIVYASLRHNDDLEGEIIQETTLIHPKEREANAENVRIRKMSEDKLPNIYDEEIIKQPFNEDKDLNEKPIQNNEDLKDAREEYNKPIENGDSVTTTDTISDSLVNASSVSPPDTELSSPNTPKLSPNHSNMSPNNSVNNINGIVKKNSLKATLSLDPATLYRGTIPYEKKKESLGHELPREEECSC